MLRSGCDLNWATGIGCLLANVVMRGKTRRVVLMVIQEGAPSLSNAQDGWIWLSQLHLTGPPYFGPAELAQR